MGPLDFVVHMLSFAAPALVVALVMALGARWLLPRAERPRWWVAFLANAVVGLLVLAGGLAWFGRDGKMTTYAILVLVQGTVAWFQRRPR